MQPHKLSIILGQENPDCPEYHQYHSFMGYFDENNNWHDAYCIMNLLAASHWDEDVDFLFCNKNYPYNYFDPDPSGSSCWGNAYNNLYSQ